MSKPEIHNHRARQERAFRGRCGRKVRKRPAASTLRQKKAASTVSKPKRFWQRISWSSVFFWAAFCALLVLQVFLIRGGLDRQHMREQEVLDAQAEKEAMEEHIRDLEEAAPATVELRYLVPNMDDIVERVPYGAPVILHDPVELQGYTFLYWEGPDGTPETRNSFTLFEDLVLTARYALPLETEEHIPYLSVDEDGVVDVDAPLTMRDFVKILYKLLNIDLVGSGTFLDVGEKDSCYKAAATLKDLGILEGSELYPDDLLLFQEMLQILERFYPPSDADYEFLGLTLDREAQEIYSTAAGYGWIDTREENDPSAVVTRGRFARVMNRVLGRASARPEESRVGMILDVGPTNPYYADIAEAVIPHSYTRQDSSEVWTGSIPLPVHEPGTFFAGVHLHCITEDGTPLRNTTVDGRSFNANGELTSGDPELDRELWGILEETVVPDAMSPLEMLRLLYDYVCENFSPAEDTIYPIGAEGWAVKEAWRILNNGEASSYGYSALFYELAYMIGYQPKLIAGTIYGTQTQFETEDGIRVEAHAGHMPHAWVEISMEGVSFIFDPASESQVDTYRQYFQRNDPIRWQRAYRSDVF